jgi:hypothetical protein
MLTPGINVVGLARDRELPIFRLMEAGGVITADQHQHGCVANYQHGADFSQYGGHFTHVPTQNVPNAPNDGFACLLADESILISGLLFDTQSSQYIGAMRYLRVDTISGANTSTGLPIPQ